MAIWKKYGFYLVVIFLSVLLAGLISLWVRSYFLADHISFRLSSDRNISINSVSGRITLMIWSGDIVNIADRTLQSGYFVHSVEEYNMLVMQFNAVLECLGMAANLRLAEDEPAFEWRLTTLRDGKVRTIAVPHWFLIVLTGCAGVILGWCCLRMLGGKKRDLAPSEPSQQD